MADTVYLYVAGTAGSGKSTFCSALSKWMNDYGYDYSLVNLDPGAEYLPYEPNFDVREVLDIPSVMEEHHLGPNGAQIAAADLMAVNFEDIAEHISALPGDYIIIDTPGQIELFAFRAASRKILEGLNMKRSAIAFVLDPGMCMKAADFVSQTLLAATVHVRFPVPFINILSKIDLIEDEDLDRILKWSTDDDALITSLINEGIENDLGMNTEIFKVMNDMGLYRAMTPVSSTENFGLDEVYNILQNTFAGGEDLESDVISSPDEDAGTGAS